MEPVGERETDPVGWARHRKLLVTRPSASPVQEGRAERLVNLNLLEHCIEEDMNRLVSVGSCKFCAKIFRQRKDVTTY